MTTPSFEIDSIGTPRRESPLELPSAAGFVEDDERLLVEPYTEPARRGFAEGGAPASFEVAGPRARIYFDPAKTSAAIVTCGGLCPGLNDVIRALVMQLWYRYGVRSIFGVGYGYRGLARKKSDLEDPEPDLRPLTPDDVDSIHEQGGTILGTSRGGRPGGEAVEALARKGINLLFAVGGDGTMRGALEMSEAARERGLELAVVGLPKTIDNDIPWVRRSFGFETAVMLATQAVRSAHVEASSALNAIGLVKLMGRYSGYIAANATLATGHANFCLVPEVPFRLEGEGGLLDLLDRQLARSSHAVIVVAEGAGQSHFPEARKKQDLSGNPRLGDIGVYLKERIASHVGDRSPLKYIDPSYLIRAAPANPSDSLFCARLAHNAVHAAMTGKTAMLIGYWHGRMTHVPLSALSGRTKTINPTGELWLSVLESTGQPLKIGAP